MATMQDTIFCFREFIKTESPTAVQRAFRLRFNIQPPTKNSICRWNHQFEQIGCLCKSKSSGRPRVSEENVRRIQETFEGSPRKSIRRASREMGIPQPTVWCLFGAPFTLQLSPSFWIILYIGTKYLIIYLYKGILSSRLWNNAVWRAVANILRKFIPCRWSPVSSFEVF